MKNMERNNLILERKQFRNAVNTRMLRSLMQYPCYSFDLIVKNKSYHGFGQNA